MYSEESVTQAGLSEKIFQGPERDEPLSIALCLTTFSLQAIKSFSAARLRHQTGKQKGDISSYRLQNASRLICQHVLE